MTKKLIIKNKAGVQTHGADSSQFQSVQEFCLIVGTTTGYLLKE